MYYPSYEENTSIHVKIAIESTQEVFTNSFFTKTAFSFSKFCITFVNKEGLVNMTVVVSFYWRVANLFL